MTFAGVYAYADWCMSAPSTADASTDPATAVIVCFYEDIPATHGARADMPRWFTFDEVANNRTIFTYMIGDDSYRDLIAYMARRRHLHVPRERDARRD